MSEFFLEGLPSDEERIKKNIQLSGLFHEGEKIKFKGQKCVITEIHRELGTAAVKVLQRDITNPEILNIVGGLVPLSEVEKISKVKKTQR